MTYFASDDVDGAATRISEAGGALVFEPMDVGPMGRMVIARDPEGHPFGVWQAGEHIGARIYNEPGALVWNDAAVDDTAAARDFYAKVFDFSSCGRRHRESGRKGHDAGAGYELRPVRGSHRPVGRGVLRDARAAGLARFVPAFCGETLKPGSAQPMR